MKENEVILTEQAEELFGRQVPVPLTPDNLSSVSSALMKLSWRIFKDAYPDQGRQSQTYHDNFGTAYGLAAEQLSRFVYDPKNPDVLMTGYDLRAFRAKTSAYGSRRKRAAKKRKAVRQYKPELDERIELPKMTKPTEKEMPVTFNRIAYKPSVVTDLCDKLVVVADTTEPLPSDTTVSALTGVDVIHCRLARERLVTKGYHMHEMTDGMWLITARPEKPVKASPNGLYTADEVAELMSKMRKGEI